MRGVIIRDGVKPGGGGELEFDLAEVLTALGGHVETSFWRARGLWYKSHDGKEIETLERLRDGATVGGNELLQSVPRVLQIIDGEFTASAADDLHPWAIVRAVESSWWEVLTDDPAVLARIRARFRVLQFFPVLPI